MRHHKFNHRIMNRQSLKLMMKRKRNQVFKNKNLMKMMYFLRRKINQWKSLLVQAVQEATPKIFSPNKHRSPLALKIMVAMMNRIAMTWVSLWILLSPTSKSKEKNRNKSQKRKKIHKSSTSTKMAVWMIFLISWVNLLKNKKLLDSVN